MPADDGYLDSLLAADYPKDGSVPQGGKSSWPALRLLPGRSFKA